jgi:hypothetical protein
MAHFSTGMSSTTMKIYVPPLPTEMRTHQPKNLLQMTMVCVIQKNPSNKGSFFKM